MKLSYTWGAVVLAALAISGCAKQSDLDALEKKVDDHRAASQQWADSINVLLYQAQKCVEEENCGGISPDTPPPANSKW